MGVRGARVAAVVSAMMLTALTGGVAAEASPIAGTSRAYVAFGYPEIGNGRGGVCVVNLSSGINGSSAAHLPLAVPVRIEELLGTINTHAATTEHLGDEYVDTDVAGTGTCAHPSTQWVRSIIDIPGAGDGLRMPIHPTALGERAVADLINARL